MAAPTRVLRAALLKLNASTHAHAKTTLSAAKGAAAASSGAHIVYVASARPATPFNAPTSRLPAGACGVIFANSRDRTWKVAGIGAARYMSVASVTSKLATQTGLAGLEEVVTSDKGSEAILNILQDPTPHGWWPSQIIEAGLVGLHEWSALPWGLTIMVATAALRMTLLPLVIYQMRNVSRLAYIRDEMEVVTKRFQALGGIRGPPQAYDQMQKQLNAMYKKHDCYPMRSLVFMMVQAPIMISMFFALRRMAQTYPSFTTGGELWFVDLSVTDPTFALPLVAAALTFCTIEFGTETGQALSQQQGNTKNFMRAFSIAVVPITVMAGIPNSVLVYWVTTNSLSLTTAAILKVPGLKPALGILPPPEPKKTEQDAVKKAAVTAPIIPGVVFASRQQAKQHAETGAASSSAPAAAATATPSAPAKAKGLRVKRRGYAVLAADLQRFR